MTPAVIDERGRACPHPVIALAAALSTNTVVDLIADDPAAQFDIPAWCRLKGANLVETQVLDDGSTRYRVAAPGAGPT